MSTSGRPLCIYHANCADGLGAAWAVHKALPDVEFVAAKYGDSPYSSKYWHIGGIVGRDILIVDFSYPLEVLKAMAKEARSVLVIDHHKTALEDLNDLAPPEYGWKEWQKEACPQFIPETNLAAIFDLSRSGAGLTWDYLHPTTTHQHPERGAVTTPIRN